jgi:CheY-like chemotaxis protein
MRSTAIDHPLTGLAELSRAARSGEPYDLILLDFMMPHIDGFEFVERLRADSQLRETSVIMASSSPLPGHVDRSRKLGVVCYLKKPVLEAELLDALLQYIGRPAVADAAEKPLPSPPAAGPRLRVLLAEDGRINQHVAVGLLRIQGHAVVVAEDGKAAVEAWEREPFDVILMDVQMPEMDGYEATAAIRRREQQTGTHTPIIALTASAMRGDRERCLEAGMDGYLAKPIDRGKLYEVLADLRSPEPVPERVDQAAPVDQNAPVDQAAATNEAAATAPVESPAACGSQPSWESPSLEPDADDVVDFKSAEQLIPGGLEAVCAMSTLLVDECLDMLEKVRKAIQQKDAIAVRRGAHTIKGSADVFRAQGVVESARQLEQLASDEQLDEAPAVFAELEREVQRMVAAIEVARDRVLSQPH